MTKYDKLFQGYVFELINAVIEEEERFERIRKINQSRFESKQELEKWIQERFGPISIQGRIIAVFRKYWLKCEELNMLGEDEYANPRDFVVDWLSGTYQELYEIIKSMPYYPIGVDEEGSYC
ncbi:hypothetical protein [Bacillus sp. AFS017336]|uniref:hypothetical protein n=1 Tax=Bacillus sp. AFS017336 TaxID=2033489 RepID=UPI000BEF7348|nr:hypothetical protein [Bacillus sp. AFS017336]PEK98846.1 hypothetical protein CN601_24780 [Bacillus sp. AFS017336]